MRVADLNDELVPLFAAAGLGDALRPVAAAN